MRTTAAIVVVGLATLLAGCAGGVGFTRTGPAAPAPVFRVGDRWVYEASDGYRSPITWTETHEVTAAGADGITVRVTLKGESVDMVRTEVLASPGVVREGAVYEAETDRFDPPLERYRYPRAPGESWSQRLRVVDRPPTVYGPVTRYVKVDGYETVTVPAGTFEALRLRVIMQLDDETFWRWPTQCEYVLWYAPEVGATVREAKRSSYRDKGGDDPASYHPGQNAMLRLVSFTRGKT